MPWTKPQRMTAGKAARDAGLNDEQRAMILRRFGNRAVHGGRITSTSPKLTNDDFEEYMATVESMAGGALPGPGGRVTPGKCDAKSRREIARQAHKIKRMANSLLLTGHLHADEQGQPVLDAVIDRATAGQCNQLNQLTRSQASKVIDALRAIGRRHGIQWQDEGVSHAG